MDFIALAENLGMEVEEIVALLKLFHEESVADLDAMQRAFEKRAKKGVVEAAKSIKGSAINLGLQGIHKIAKEIEQNARGKSLKGIEPSVQLLKGKLDQLAESLQNNSLLIV
jgi:HPt (histidine-containing phosphotransfer) domain-containing protein